MRTSHVLFLVSELLVVKTLKKNSSLPESVRIKAMIIYV